MKIVKLTYQVGKTGESGRESRWSNFSNILVYSLMGLYIATFSILSILQHNRFNTYDFDLGIHDQILWGYSQGQIPVFSSLLGMVGLGDHMTPIMILLTPLYWIYSDARTLLVFQSLLLALGALPIYWLARDELRSNLVAVCLAAGYLLFPALQYMTLYQFHPDVLSTPLLLFMLYYLYKEKYVRYFIFMALSLMCQEPIALPIVILGLGICFFKRKIRLGTLTAASALIWFVIAIWVLIPFFSDQPYRHIGPRFDYLGENFSAVVKTLIKSPLLVLQRLLIWPKLVYVFHLFAPLGFIPFLGLPVLLPALAPLGYSLISDYPPLYSIEWYYQAPAIPFIFMGAVFGIRRIRELVGGRGLLNQHGNYLICSVILISSLLANRFFSPSPFSVKFDIKRYFDTKDYQVTEHNRLAKSIMGLIPKDASLSTQAPYIPHLTHRREIYRFPKLNQVEYVFLNKRVWFRKDFLGLFNEFLDNEDYGVIFQKESYFLFKRGAHHYLIMQESPKLENPLNANFGNEVMLVGSHIESDVVHPGTKLSLSCYWKSLREVPKDYRILVHFGEGDAYFRKKISLVDSPKKGWLRITADDRYSLYVNGALVGSDDQWQSLEEFDITPWLAQGDNVVAVHVTNYGGKGGLLLEGEIKDILGNNFSLTSNSTWKISKIIAPNWTTSQFDDNLWENAVSQGSPPVGPWGDTVSSLSGAEWVWHQTTSPNVFHHEHWPADGWYFTSHWSKEKLIRDKIEILVPSSVLPGIYKITIGMYDPESKDTLGVLDETKRDAPGRVKIGSVKVIAN